jgi:hypothetical protein
MSVHTSAHSPGVFLPEELGMLRSLMDEMRGEGFPRTAADEERLAAFLLKTYDRGVTCRAKLKAYCNVALKLYFRERAGDSRIDALLWEPRRRSEG